MVRLFIMNEWTYPADQELEWNTKLTMYKIHANTKYTHKKTEKLSINNSTTATTICTTTTSKQQEQQQQ